MFRFTIRDLLWLMVLMAMFVAWYAERRRERSISPALSKHFGERLDAAKKEFVSRESVIGRRDVRAQLECLRQWAEAAVESDLRPADKLKECELALAEAQQIRQVVQDKYEADVEPMMNVERARFTVAHIQVQLQRARKEARWFRLP